MEHLFAEFVNNHVWASLGVLILGLICFLIRGWISHVDKNIDKLWQRHDEENKARELRWTNLSKQCRDELAEFAEIRGVLIGKGLIKS